MSIRPPCNCPLCELEQALLTDLRRAETSDDYRELSSQNPSLAAFPTCDQFLTHLREQEENAGGADTALGELLKSTQVEHQALSRHLVLLILMPAIHKTSTQIAFGFPSLTRDDIAQQLLTFLLEFMGSDTLLSSQSHFAFTIVRAMRRDAFRWAIREADRLLTLDPEISVNQSCEDPASTLEPRVFLKEFLNTCLVKGALTEFEYEQLVLFKIQGQSAQTLAGQQRISEIAFRHRMQRVLDKLRRVARSDSTPIPQSDSAAA